MDAIKHNLVVDAHLNIFNLQDLAHRLEAIGQQGVDFRVVPAYPYTGTNGDATFPDWVALGSYSFRFGKVKQHQATPAMPAPGTRQDG